MRLSYNQPESYTSIAHKCTIPNSVNLQLTLLTVIPDAKVINCKNGAAMLLSHKCTLSYCLYHVMVMWSTLAVFLLLSVPSDSVLCSSALSTDSCFRKQTPKEEKSFYQRQGTITSVEMFHEKTKTTTMKLLKHAFNSLIVFWLPTWIHKLQPDLM